MWTFERVLSAIAVTTLIVLLGASLGLFYSVCLLISEVVN